MHVMIRPVEPQDVDGVFGAVDHSRRELDRWMVWFQPSYSSEDAANWVRRGCAEHLAGTGYHFVMCDQEGVVMGVISFENVDAATATAMLGYWVSTPATGRGVAKSAIAQALAWASTHTNIRRVWAQIAPDNVASRKVAEANGFRLADGSAPPSGATHHRFEVSL